MEIESDQPHSSTLQPLKISTAETSLLGTSAVTVQSRSSTPPTSAPTTPSASHNTSKLTETTKNHIVSRSASATSSNTNISSHQNTFNIPLELNTSVKDPRPDKSKSLDMNLEIPLFVNGRAHKPRASSSRTSNNHSRANSIGEAKLISSASSSPSNAAAASLNSRSTRVSLDKGQARRSKLDELIANESLRSVDNENSISSIDSENKMVKQNVDTPVEQLGQESIKSKAQHEPVELNVEDRIKMLDAMMNQTNCKNKPPSLILCEPNKSPTLSNLPPMSKLN